MGFDAYGPVLGRKVWGWETSTQCPRYFWSCRESLMLYKLLYKNDIFVIHEPRNDDRKGYASLQVRSSFLWMSRGIGNWEIETSVWVGSDILSLNPCLTFIMKNKKGVKIISLFFIQIPDPPIRNTCQNLQYEPMIDPCGLSYIRLEV